VKLDACGDPIHTRSLGVGLSWRADGRLDLRGQLLDLRKRGCVPVAGGLQGSGLIHQALRSGRPPRSEPKESGAH
jgi:hypothetical protein